MTHKNSVLIVCLLIFAAAGWHRGMPKTRINTGDFDVAQISKFEKTFAWAQFTYDFSEHQWCVDAQRRDALPGEYVGGCFKTLDRAVSGMLKRRKPMPEKPKPKVVMFDMDDERKERFRQASSRIVDICQKECRLTPIETYAVLKLCLDSLASVYHIEGSYMLDNETEMKQ